MADIKLSEGRNIKKSITNPLPTTGSKVKKESKVGDAKVNIDLSDNIKQLKAIQREARKAIKVLRELEEAKKNKYLVIELDNLGNVPKVFYKGEEVRLKEFVNFQWTTRTDMPGSTDIIVDYYEKDLEEGKFISKSIREGIES